jgi:hypothetical protein
MRLCSLSLSLSLSSTNNETAKFKMLNLIENEPNLEKKFAILLTM